MLTLSRLLTGPGQRILSVPDEGRLVHGLAGEGGAADVLAMVSTQFDRHCFLLDGGTRTAPLRCGHPMHRAPALPMHLHRQAAGAAVSLVYPVNRKYLCARPAEEREQFGTVWADHDDPGPGRIFELEVVAGDEAPPAARALAGAIEALFVERDDAVGLLRRLDGLAAPAGGAALEAILPALTTPQLDRLAAALLAEPERIAVLAGLLQPDVWSRQGLPQLAAWLARRRPAAVAGAAAEAVSSRPVWRRLFGRAAAGTHAIPTPASEPAPDLFRTAAVPLGPDYDEAALPHWRNGFVSSSQELGAALRRAVEPSRRVCLVAPARNEGIYLLEWIAYHRAIGVEAFFLYTNDNQDGSDVLLDALCRAGVITWFDNQSPPRGSALGRCYGHALSVLPETLAFRWAIFIDLDEFVVVDPNLFASLGDYIDWQELQDVDAIALNWMFMRSSSRGALDGLLTERCRRQSAEFDSHVKSLCRPRRFVQTTSHFPLAGERRSVVLRSASGGLHRPGSSADLSAFEAPSRSAVPDGAMAWVNHYFFKSAEEYMWKFSRNRGGTSATMADISVGLTPRFLDAFLQQAHDQRASAETPLLACQAAASAELTGLLALPGVAAALEQVQERYRTRLTRVREAFARAPVIAEAGRRGEEFLALAMAST